MQVWQWTSTLVDISPPRRTRLAAVCICTPKAPERGRPDESRLTLWSRKRGALTVPFIYGRVHDARFRCLGPHAEASRRGKSRTVEGSSHQNARMKPRNYPARNEALLAYYLLQYERIAAHETARVQLTSLVVSGSVVALGALTVTHVDRPLLIGVLVLVAMTNCLAVMHTWNGRRWVKIHQERARLTAKRLVGSELREIEKAASANRTAAGARAVRRHLAARQSNILIFTHASVVVFALTMLVITALR